jgi:hypothetical protein
VCDWGCSLLAINAYVVSDRGMVRLAQFVFFWIAPAAGRQCGAKPAEVAVRLSVWRLLVADSAGKNAELNAAQIGQIGVVRYLRLRPHRPVSTMWSARLFHHFWSVLTAATAASCTLRCGAAGRRAARQLMRYQTTSSVLRTSDADADPSPVAAADD